MATLVLSHVQAEPLLRARQTGQGSARSSPDLGLSQVEVALEPDGVVFPGQERLPWPGLEAIAAAENRCFLVADGVPRPIEAFSETLGRVYTLMPTGGAPTMLISGIPMHRIKGIDPWQDTALKIRTVAPVTGRVLDTATGLGYTAIQAARTAESVVTIELDPAVLDVARLNPWSRPLFDNPMIEQLVGDAYEVVQGLQSQFFSRIIHDPPTFTLAGELYSAAFYRELYRLLRRSGRLFHYVGDPESRLGRRVTRGVAERLRQAGFQRIVRRPEAFGLLACK